MWNKIISFFMSVVMFFMGLFGLGDGKTDKPADGGVDIVFEQNLRYADGGRNVFDFAYPEKASGEIGLVLAIHGGAWVSGGKENEKVRLCVTGDYMMLSDIM